jgi:hypothetical protein
MHCLILAKPAGILPFLLHGALPLSGWRENVGAADQARVPVVSSQKIGPV